MHFFVHFLLQIGPLLSCLVSQVRALFAGRQWHAAAPVLGLYAGDLLPGASALR